MKRISAILVMGMAVAAIGVLGLATMDQGEAQAMVQPASWHPEVPAPVPVQDAEYVGARDGCRRCHIREYRSWEDTPHATAMETLESEGEAGNAECLKCHTTGFGEPTGFTSMEETEHLANVQCEACHGPGSVYRDKDIMEDREASIAAGMVLPDEATCTACHNEESPTFQGFNFEEALETGVHDIDR